MNTITPDTELFFPLRLVHCLKDSRAYEWKKLINQISKIDGCNINSLSFQLLMVRLAGCANCDSDSYRAMRGCEFCAKQTLKRYKGTDTDLVNVYYRTKEEIKEYLQNREQ
jgi:hypothetical protein